MKRKRVPTSGEETDMNASDRNRAQRQLLIKSPSLADQKVFAHKLLLQFRSQHFRAMFATGMKEATMAEIGIYLSIVISVTLFLSVS